MPKCLANRVRVFNRLRGGENAACMLALVLASAIGARAAAPVRAVPLALTERDVIATGNEWISLPTIRASDGALMNFNVLSMHSRGLLQVEGDQGSPVLQPYFTVDAQPLAFQKLSWEVIEYWIPVAHTSAHGLEISMTYCAPPGSRGAFIRLTITNHRATRVQAGLGMKASWGGLSRVTYTPVERKGERTVSDAPWVPSGEVFSFATDDTDFAWSLLHPDSQATAAAPPLGPSPGVDAVHNAVLEPGQTAEANFIIGAGVEEFSAAHNAKALGQIIDRLGAEAVIKHTADWCRQRARTTGDPKLDALMNRNLLFTAFYAWGKTIDTEQFVGVTSRSPRYYVSAAYWDRDAMLWSFPGLLDIDRSLAREALEYAFTTQLRNTGLHSRFIDGIVLEDGLQLDELVAPVHALTQYITATNDEHFLIAHRQDLLLLRDRILNQFDPATGLYATLQDSQDEYEKLPFNTYDNVLTWRVLLDMSSLLQRLGNSDGARQMEQRAASLREAIMQHCVSSDAPGAEGTVFVTATDGKIALFTEVPPGSLLRLPALGFISEDDPLFVRTYRWLHSKNYAYSHAGEPYGLPGSYRLPFTSCWSVADHLLLKQGRESALKILLGSTWDGESYPRESTLIPV